MTPRLWKDHDAGPSVQETHLGSHSGTRHIVKISTKEERKRHEITNLRAGSDSHVAFQTLPAPSQRGASAKNNIIMLSQDEASFNNNKAKTMKQSICEKMTFFTNGLLHSFFSQLLRHHLCID